MKHIIKLYIWVENIWFKLPEKLRYLLVGGFNTVFSYSMLFALTVAFDRLNNINDWGLNKAIIANICLFIQYALCINLSFATMRYYVFRSKGDWKKECIKTYMVYAFMYSINAPILTILIVFLGLHVMVSQAIYLLFSTVTTFFLHKYFSFRNNK